MDALDGDEDCLTLGTKKPPLVVSGQGWLFEPRAWGARPRAEVPRQHCTTPLLSLCVILCPLK